MSDPHGPPVGDSEDLYRAIIHCYWWLEQCNRPTSAAFDHPVFSVDIASRTTPQATLSRFRPGAGLISFNCGEARSLGFDTRDECDPAFLQNNAHAHVYFDGSRSQRKVRARALVDVCSVVVTPRAVE